MSSGADSRPSPAAGFRTGLRCPSLRFSLAPGLLAADSVHGELIHLDGAMLYNPGVQGLTRRQAKTVVAAETLILKHSIYVVNNPVFLGPGDGGNIRSIWYATKRGHPFSASVYKVVLISSSSLFVATQPRLDIPYTAKDLLSSQRHLYQRWQSIHLRR